MFEAIKQAISALSPVYATAGGFAAADGPLPYGDLAASAIAGAATVGAIGYATYKTIAKPRVNSKDRVDAIPKTPTKPTQYWAADQYANQLEPLTYSQASSRVATGGNVMCKNQKAALALVGMYSNRILDQAKRNGYYNHYHLNNYTSKPHIWFYGPIYLEESRIRNK